MSGDEGERLSAITVPGDSCFTGRSLLENGRFRSNELSPGLIRDLLTRWNEDGQTGPQFVSQSKLSSLDAGDAMALFKI